MLRRFIVVIILLPIIKGAIDITQCLRRRNGAHVSGIIFYLHIASIDSEEGCVGKCLEDLPRCKSVVYDSVNRDCQLYSAKGTSPPAFLFPAQGRIYYEFGWKRCLDRLLATPAPTTNTPRVHHVAEIPSNPKETIAPQTLTSAYLNSDNFRRAEPLFSHKTWGQIEDAISHEGWPETLEETDRNLNIHNYAPPPAKSSENLRENLNGISKGNSKTADKKYIIPIQRIDLQEFLLHNRQVVDKGPPPCSKGESRIYLQFNSTIIHDKTPIQFIDQVSPGYCMRRCDNTQDCVAVSFEQSILKLGSCKLLADVDSLFQHQPLTSHITDTVLLLQVCIPQSKWDTCNHDIFPSYTGKLARGKPRKSLIRTSLQACVTSCVEEESFRCLSASYVRDRKECRLNAQRLSASIVYGNYKSNKTKETSDTNIFYFENFCAAGRVLVDRIAGPKPLPEDLIRKYSRKSKTDTKDTSADLNSFSIVQEPSVASIPQQTTEDPGHKESVQKRVYVAESTQESEEDYSQYFYGPHRFSLSSSETADNLQASSRIAPSSRKKSAHHKLKRGDSVRQTGAIKLPGSRRVPASTRRLESKRGYRSKSGSSRPVSTRGLPREVGPTLLRGSHRDPKRVVESTRAVVNPHSRMTNWTDWSECEEVEGKRAKLRIRTCLDNTFKCPGQKVDVWSCE